MKSILCLARGDAKSIEMLKVRNMSIDTNLVDKSIPNIIFHEGNISRDDQRDVIACTPNLETRFIDVSGQAFNPEFGKIEIDNATIGFGLGYRHMCHFWFIDFWKFVNDYRLVIRIDDDCRVKCNLDRIFTLTESHSIVSGQWSLDHPSFTKELNNFFRRSLESIDPVQVQTQEAPGGPYSNFMALNLDKLRNSLLLQKFLMEKKTELTNNIYRYRWGDLPLWGKVCQHLLERDYLISDQIQYFHGSHNQYVNAPYSEKDYNQDSIMFNRKSLY